MQTIKAAGYMLLVLAAFWLGASLTRSHNPWQRVYERSNGSVVEIFAFTLKGELGSTGTGFVFEAAERLFILTNRHVAPPSLHSFARFSDGETRSTRLFDASELHDLAFLEPDEGISLRRFGSLPPGQSSTLRIGEEVMTIGHPIHESHHISVGFFAGRQTDARGRTLLRLSMAVDPGNSGGPLLNRRGQVVGVVTQKLRESANIAFAIPIEKVRELSFW